MFLGVRASDARATETPVTTTGGETGATGAYYSSNGSELVQADIGRWMGLGRCQAIKTAQASQYSNNAFGQGVYFGTGSTPATLSDYTLESPITSGLSITNPSKLVWTDNGMGRYAVKADFILTNTAENEVNIYEIGLISFMYKDDLGYLYPFLMERTVLPEPITIPAGGIKLVTYKITFNQVLNVDQPNP